eukprot:2447173-Rhodomonas_salina.1
MLPQASGPRQSLASVMASVKSSFDLHKPPDSPGEKLSYSSKLKLYTVTALLPGRSVTCHDNCTLHTWLP